MGTDRKILLTGASGVIGQELLPRLPVDQVLVGRHRARPDGAHRQIAIDIRKPQLGLDAADYCVLCEEVGTVLHCAAITDMSGQAPELSVTNIQGVHHIVALAEAAGAKLHFVSTAYCSKRYGPAQPVASDYVASKREAEAVVRTSRVDWTIIRPSIVAGHSKTGAIASFQGFHMFIAAILKGRLPIIPLARETQCDFVPVDWVASAIAKIVEGPVWGETFWLTSGAEALTIADMMETGKSLAASRGRDLDQTTLMTAERVENDILPQLRPRSRERLRLLVELSKVMGRARPFPSDLEQVSKGRLRDALHANLDYWMSRQT